MLSKNKKRPSAPRENTPPDGDRRRLRTRQTPDQRRKYDRSRNQSPERKEYNRQRRHQDRQTARETGKCRGCPNPSLPNSGRCQACTEKHRKYSVARRARQKSEREINEQGRSQAQHSIWDPTQENLRAREPIPSNTNVGNSKPPRPSASASTAPSPQYPDRPGVNPALRSTASAAARTTQTDGQGRKLNGNSPAAQEHSTRPMQTNPSDPTPRRVFFEMHFARIGRLSEPFGDQQNTMSGLTTNRRIGEALYTSEGIAPAGFRANSTDRHQSTNPQALPPTSGT